MGEGVIALDSERRITFFSRRAQEITGLAPADVLGKSCGEAICQDLCRLAATASEAGPFDIVARSRLGRTLHLEVRAGTVRCPAGASLGRVLVFRDRTGEIELRRQLDERASHHGITGDSPAMRRVLDLVAAAADHAATVLIEGETGTGKEMVARAIHALGPRSSGPFHAVNCGALPPDLLESELFGHAKGAFTGALRDKAGRVELAQGGTLLLDEVADLPLAMQVKLLRLLQEHEYVRLGDTQTRRLDARIIAATNVDLRGAVRDGRFRQDLYYRLHVIPIRLPPLRERREDVLPLARLFLARLNLEAATPKRLSAAATRALLSHPWPGNVRELQNTIAFAFYRAPGEEITSLDLPPEAAERGAEAAGSDAATLEADRLREALERAGGNKAAAARALGIDRTTLWRKLKAPRAAPPSVEAAE
jgi:PAS domain S-box-containing protein